MTTRLASADWAADRGAKWNAHLAGLEAMLAPLDGPLFRALHLDAPCRIADVGCGGGRATAAIARLAPAGSVVHGFDISPDLVASAGARHGSSARTLAFAVSDVATASAPDVLYDRLVSRFGILFFDYPPAAFANLARWLAPGGRLAFAVWGRPDDNPWTSSIRDVLTQFIDLPQPAPEAPGPFRYADAGTLVALLEDAGLARLDVHDWRGALSLGGGLAAAEAAHFALASSSVGELVADAGDQVSDAVRDALTTRFSRHEQDGSVRMDACVHIVTGAHAGGRGRVSLPSV
jgi:SAM-dependent methyltransferase